MLDHIHLNRVLEAGFLGYLDSKQLIIHVYNYKTGADF